MAYEYYCTHCASKVSNKTVLFDLQPLLTGSVNKKFDILKFRLTEEELLALIRSGTPGENNRARCALSLQNIMDYMAGKNNLNDSRVAGLTLQDIEEFISEGLLQQPKSAQQQKNDDDVFWSSEDTDDDDADQKAPDEQLPVEKPTPEAIEALLAKDITVDNAAFTKQRVLDDLRILRTLFVENDQFSFSVTPVNEKDDKGNDVLTGVAAFTEGHSIPMHNNRVCPRCGESIFEHAGTAEHRSVVFLGYQSSGKTSTILALTHYACNHMRNDMGSNIWTGAATLDCIESVDHLAPSPRLKNELDCYNDGIAPEKTAVSKREDAYSSTLLVRSKVGEKTVNRILTLTDLPGELCVMGGKLKTQDIYDKFAVATACDTFVVCLDTSTVERAANGDEAMLEVKNENGDYVRRTPSQIIDDTCKWADEFQKMLLQESEKKMYVPAMLLFTKCHQLENETEEETAPKGILNPIKQIYMFRKEQNAIESNHIYDVACKSFNNQGGLPNAFHAMLRCSPYGYNAPAINVVKKTVADNRERILREKPEFAGYFEEYKPSLLSKITRAFQDLFENRLKRPEPRNIDNLMRWILCVNGCIPTVSQYKPHLSSSEVLEINDYYINRTQHREQNPQKGQEVEEALARCRLFENPGKYDQTFVKFYAQKARLFTEKLMAKPNTNAET